VFVDEVDGLEPDRGLDGLLRPGDAVVDGVEDATQPADRPALRRREHAHALELGEVARPDLPCDPCVSAVGGRHDPAARSDCASIGTVGHRDVKQSLIAHRRREPHPLIAAVLGVEGEARHAHGDGLL